MSGSIFLNTGLIYIRFCKNITIFLSCVWNIQVGDHLMSFFSIFAYVYTLYFVCFHSIFSGFFILLSSHFIFFFVVLHTLYFLWEIGNGMLKWIEQFLELIFFSSNTKDIFACYWLMTTTI